MFGMVRAKGEVGDVVTPNGKPESVTMTVWLKPLFGVSLRFTLPF